MTERKGFKRIRDHGIDKADVAPGAYSPQAIGHADRQAGTNNVPTVLTFVNS